MKKQNFKPHQEERRDPLVERLTRQDQKYAHEIRMQQLQLEGMEKRGIQLENLLGVSQKLVTMGADAIAKSIVTMAGGPIGGLRLSMRADNNDGVIYELAFLPAPQAK